MPHQTDYDQEHDQEQHRASKEKAEILQATIERGLLGARCEAGGDVAEGGSGAGRDYQSLRGSTDDRCAEEDHILRVGLGGDLFATRLFFDWQRFAR